MKTYIVYDSRGTEQGYLRLRGEHNVAEAKAKAMFGERASVAYTELGPEFDHVISGYFNDEQAK